MYSLLTDTEKAEAAAALLNVWYTFAREITIYKQNDVAIISYDSNQYNFMYSNTSQPSVQFSQEIVSGVFSGTINWPSTYKTNDYQQIRPTIDGEYAYVDLLQDGLNFLSGYTEVIIDGRNCKRIGTYTPQGIFDIEYYQLTFRADN